jgi:predicted deacylase
MFPERVTTIDFDGLPDHKRLLFDLEVVPLADGRVLTIPVQVFAGSGPRPLFVVVAGIHGDEPEGVLALLDLAREVVPEQLKGRLVIVPVANPPAFAAGHRLSPLDHADLNRSFPGNSEGGPSLRLAHRLMETLVRPADLLFTVHSWYSSGIAVDFIEAAPPEAGTTAAAAFAAARASGFERIRIIHWPSGLLAHVAISNGIPAIEAEIGGLGRSLPENRTRYKDHVRALMTHIGMADDPPARPAQEVCEARHILAPVGGLLRTRAELGDRVRPGALLGTIHDLHDRLLAEVTAPASGYVGAHRTFVPVNPGDNLFTIFRPIG